MSGLRRFLSSVPTIGLAVAMFSCANYKANIMFKPEEGFQSAKIQKDAIEAEKNYVIQVNDYLELEVFSNQGERIIDPNGELLKDKSANMQDKDDQEKPRYLVMVDGTAKFPMIGSVRLVGLTIRQAEEVLEQEYNKFYKESYVTLEFTNKRVLVLGATGGQVIPLVNENVTLVEVLALAKGFGNDGKAKDIRLFRGKDAYLIDFSTIDGLQKGNMIIQPGDLVYVEPLRRPFVEGSRDIAPMLSMVVSFVTLVIVLLEYNNP
jgi:polysaccharide export outer membrane protein